MCVCSAASVHAEVFNVRPRTLNNEVKWYSGSALLAPATTFHKYLLLASSAHYRYRVCCSTLSVYFCAKQLKQLKPINNNRGASCRVWHIWYIAMQPMWCDTAICGHIEIGKQRDQQFIRKFNAYRKMLYTNGMCLCARPAYMPLTMNCRLVYEY